MSIATRYSNACEYFAIDVLTLLNRATAKNPSTVVLTEKNARNVPFSSRHHIPNDAKKNALIIIRDRKKCAMYPKPRRADGKRHETPHKNPKKSANRGLEMPC
jgi:hypothetical protein